MARLFRGHEEAVARTIDIMEACRFSLDELVYEYPEEVVPEGYDANRYLRELVASGSTVRWPRGVPPAIQQRIDTELRSHDGVRFQDIPAWQTTGREMPDPALVAQDVSSIKHIMWNYVGLVRTTPRLARAIQDLRNLEVEIERFYRAAALTDELLGLRNAVRVALIVTLAAWENHESRGAHYRE
jgi:succinate dehydrogenase/fumarate reductase flavoprotein subunit